MKAFLIVFIVFSVVCNLCTLYFVYKTIRLNGEVNALRGYLNNYIAQNEALKNDFPGLLNYRVENDKLSSELSLEQRKEMTILFGASITRNWDLEKYFPDKNVLNRGVSGQNDI